MNGGLLHRVRPVRRGCAVRSAARLPLFGMLALLAVACKNADPDLVLGAPDPGRPVSLSRDVQPIFTASCVSGCHDGVIAQSDLVLDGSLTFDPFYGIVGVPSVQAPGRLRVEAGRSGRSYLVNKLEGTQASVGGLGDPMPLGGSLPDSSIETIRRWIDEGAKDN